MSEERDVIRGKLKQIVFRNDDNGYTVARFIVDDLQQRQVTITGYLPVFSEDALMELSGSYVDHPRYGMQFQVETFHRVMPDDEDSLIRFLCLVRYLRASAKNMPKRLWRPLAKTRFIGLKTTQLCWTACRK